MAAIVGIDGKIQVSTNGGGTWTDLAERNEFTINIRVDTAEHKVFVASLADAWANKARTWMSWNGSLAGYYDDEDDTIFDTVVAGLVVKLRFYNSRNTPSKYWEGDALLTSVDSTNSTDDYATLNVEFEGQGALTRV